MAFVGIFADRGLSGTSTKKRDEFNKMIKQCRRGKIDMIITKSISRFARNTADVLKYVRMLKEIGVDIFFEEQNIHSNLFMGEKVYKPIVKDGDHLIRSKDNPDRVRGLTRDENNQNPDIIEWEECDVDDLISDDYEPYPYEERRVRLTPEQEEFAQQVGKALGVAIVAGGIFLFQNVVSPLWKNTAWP